MLPDLKMPPALTTTKRKFHKILDSISNASSTSLSTSQIKHNASTTTLPASMDPPTKKARVTRPTSAYVPPSTRIIMTSKSSNRPVTASKQPSISLAPSNEERKSPNFAPWDRAQFLERLKTYRHVDKWMGKPEKINEVQWAKRGWSCIGRETVGCIGGCAKELVIKLEDDPADKENEEGWSSEEQADDNDWREKAQEQLVEKYTEMIVTWHDGGCLWRRRGCDGRYSVSFKSIPVSLTKLADTIQRLPLAHRVTAIDNLRQRYQSLLTMASELPTDPSTPEGFNISDIHARMAPLIRSSPPNHPTDGAKAAVHNPSDSIAGTASPLPVSTSALTLALFGWQAEEGHISGLATCTACFRRLGLWLFKTPPDPASQSSMNRLDVIGEHRDYCPWINGLSQTGTSSRRTSLDGLAGWQVLLRAVNAITQHERNECGMISAETVTDLDGAASEVGSVLSLATISRGRKDEDERDKERWAKLKRLKQIFHVKTGKRKEGATNKTDQGLG